MRTHHLITHIWQNNMKICLRFPGKIVYDYSKGYLIDRNLNSDMGSGHVIPPFGPRLLLSVRILPRLVGQ